MNSMLCVGYMPNKALDLYEKMYQRVWGLFLHTKIYPAYMII